MTSTGHCPLELSCRSFRSNLWAQPTSQGSCGNLGNEEEEAAGRGELPTTNQSKAPGETREREESGGEGADGLKIDLRQRRGSDSALPETNGHLPLGGQERASQRPGPRRQKSGRFQSRPCPCRESV